MIRQRWNPPEGGRDCVTGHKETRRQSRPRPIVARPIRFSRLPTFFFLLFLFFSHSKQPAHGRHQSTDDGGAKINLRRKKIEERTPAERGGIERHFSIETRFPFKELARNL